MPNSNDKGLIVSEIFESFQGEGPSLGRRSAFLRLGICNLRCSWCDTRYAWDWLRFDHKVEVDRLFPVDICERLLKLDAGMLVVTGGEPLLQQAKLLPVLEVVLRGWGWHVEVETAGTIMPLENLFRSVSRFIVSPKLENSGMSYEDRIKMDVLRLFRLLLPDRSIFKFVVKAASDLDEVEEIVLGAKIPRSRVYIMPLATEARELERPDLAEAVLKRKWNYTTRLQVITWGNRRGK